MRSSNGTGATSLCSRASSVVHAGGSRSSLVESIWPSFTKVGPSCSNASLARCCTSRCAISVTSPQCNTCPACSSSVAMRDQAAPRDEIARYIDRRQFVAGSKRHDQITVYCCQCACCQDQTAIRSARERGNCALDLSPVVLGKLLQAAREELVGRDQNGLNVLLRHGRKSGLELALRAGVKDLSPHPQRWGSRQQVLYGDLA